MAEDLTTAEGNIRANLRMWDVSHPWPEGGDEWKGQAVVCGVPYEAWKESLVAHLIVPFIGRDKRVLEIAPGHGRWSKALIEHSRAAVLVDLSPNCLATCRKKFAGKSVEYFQTEGASLPPHETAAIDLVWSFDAFVHIAPDVIASYLRETARVLKPGGAAVIHHADIADLTNHRQAGHEGWRSAVDAALMRCLAEAVHLHVVSQFTYWDTVNRVGVPRFGDKVTILEKPA